MLSYLLAESSEALMAGQKPPMQLLIQAVNGQGDRINEIAPFISDEFVVRSGLCHKTART